MTETPRWEPEVVVVGLGAAGTATVERVDTETAATLRIVGDPVEPAESVRVALESAAFVFLTGDVDETGMVGCARELAAGTDAISVFVAEGLGVVPAALAEAVNLVVPLDRDAVSPLLVSSLIADFFEAMMTPTLRNLGHGDVRVVVGDGRVGRLAVRSLDDDAHRWLSPRGDDGKPDAALVFVCAERERPLADVERVAGTADEGGLGTLLWDQRLHGRYENAAHVKHLVTTDVESASAPPRE